MGFAKRYMEEIHARGFDATEKTVCLDWIHDDVLRDECRPHIDSWACSFCGASADEDGDEPIALPFEQLMYLVMAAVTFLYQTVEDAGLVLDEGEWIGGAVIDSSDVAYAVCEWDVTGEVLEAIGNTISAPEWTDSDISSLRPDHALRFGWKTFCDKVKHESRFVFLGVTEESSGHPDEFTTAELLQRVGRIIGEHDLLNQVPAGRVFIRGRMTDDPRKVVEWRSAAALGVPPREKASNSRMSPAGIAMFYGCDDTDTVVAEIGAHDTKRYAIVGEFETIRDLTLLDLADLPPVPSLYHEAGRQRSYFDLTFLHSFARDLAQPVALDGREHIEYVPTQVITEYLRFIPDYALDGILFRSAQNDGVCCVLFYTSEGCVDPGQSDNRPWYASELATLQLRPDSVRWVRVVSKVADA